MKARIKETGEIVDVTRIVEKYVVTHHPHIVTFEKDELDFDIEDDIDYWTRLEHTYAGMAMQGMIRRAYEVYCNDCANYENMIFEDAQALLKDHAEALADVCVEFAHALVKKMKETK